MVFSKGRRRARQQLGKHSLIVWSKFGIERIKKKKTEEKHCQSKSLNSRSRHLAVIKTNELLLLGPLILPSAKQNKTKIKSNPR